MLGRNLQETQVKDRNRLTKYNKSTIHFTETHRKTSNFDMCLLNFISTCRFCFIQKIIYHLKRNWPCFSLLKFCSSSLYVINIVEFSNKPIQNLFNFPQRTSMDFCKVTFTCVYTSIKPFNYC